MKAGVRPKSKVATKNDCRTSQPGWIESWSSKEGRLTIVSKLPNTAGYLLTLPIWFGIIAGGGYLFKLSLEAQYAKEVEEKLNRDAKSKSVLQKERLRTGISPPNHSGPTFYSSDRDETNQMRMVAFFDLVIGIGLAGLMASVLWLVTKLFFASDKNKSLKADKNPIPWRDEVD
jgi:hypothetical protein